MEVKPHGGASAGGGIRRVFVGGGLRCPLSREDEERGSMGEGAGPRGFVMNSLALPREPLYLGFSSGLTSSFFLQPMS